MTSSFNSPYHLKERFASFFQKKCFQYWPDCLKTEVFGNVTIENVSEKHYASYISRKFVISHKEVNSPLCIHRFHFHVLIFDSYYYYKPHQGRNILLIQMYLFLTKNKLSPRNLFKSWCFHIFFTIIFRYMQVLC